MAEQKKDKGTPLQVWLPTEVHHKFKVLCTMRGKKMTETATNIISDWIDQETAKLKAWEKAAIEQGDKE